jgi:hypothetical protein
MSKKVLRFENDEQPDNAPSTSGQNVPKKGGKYKQDKEKTRHSDKLRVEKATNKPEMTKEKVKPKLNQQKAGIVKNAGRTVRANAWMYVHGKIYQSEHENVGIKAAHRSELAGEGVVKSSTRFVKKQVRSSSNRRVRLRKNREVKKQADRHYRAMTQENPEMKKGIARRLHKRRIKKQYQKQARKAAKKSAANTGKAAYGTTKKAVGVAKRIGRAILLFIKTNPKLAIIIALLFLIIIIMQACFSIVFQVGGGLGGGVAISTYQSEDSEMLAAESAYADMENALQYQLDNFEMLNPDYDEYHYDLDVIGHDPYALISILSAMNEGAWTLNEVQGTLAMLFDMQYTLTITVTTEVRYRNETVTDTWIDEFGVEHTETHTEQVAYNYYICNVTLENFNLSRLPVYIMNEEGLSRYAVYMATLGNRPDLFPAHAFPNASTIRDFERYGIPPEALADPVFRAMITEAEKYLGFPYVWGGSNPSTSFDCSGYVSWVINNSGWNVGRLGAKGLYNICTPVSPANARPGDLVFFWKTYRAPDPNAATHVGIYVGNGMMIHCGNPISYTSINTNYWQNHFFGFGRLP